jgi:hypothetical protein
MKTGVELIAEERQEQIEKHGFDVNRDVQINDSGELTAAALFVLTGEDNYYPSSWEEWFRNKLVSKTASTPNPEIERLKIAGALLAAEIDRLQSQLK